MIEYTYSVEGITEQQVKGFFVGWGNPPNERTLLKVLSNSDEIVLAIDKSNNQVVGFINAITDKTLMSFIPLLEVLPDYQGKGIGGKLIEKMLDRLSHFYAIDLMCSKDLQPYYERFGMIPAPGMVIRNYQNQSGA